MMITSLEPNQVFVFGSNEAGIHGAGAAAQAYADFGAVWGEGFGWWGDSFAIPTKDWDVESLALGAVEAYVTDFLSIALDHPDTEFLVTPIGTGLAGFTAEQIAPMFEFRSKNVVLPDEFEGLVGWSTARD